MRFRDWIHAIKTHSHNDVDSAALDDYLASDTKHDDLDDVNDAAAGVEHGHVTAEAQTIAGDKTFSGDVEVSSGSLDLTKTGGQNRIQIGNGQTSSQYAYIDFVGDTTYDDFGLRIIRYNSGANSDTLIEHRGTGDFILETNEAATLRLRTAGISRFLIEPDGDILSAGIYAATTGASANVYISSGAKLYRSTSSSKYKKDIEDVEDKYSEQIYNMRPIWYRSKCEDDNKEYSFWGFIAEELAEIDPRLVHYGYSEDDFEIIEKIGKEPVNRKNEKTGKYETVFIDKVKKERVLKAGAKLQPEGVQYERLTVFLVKELQKLKKEIEYLKGL